MGHCGEDVPSRRDRAVTTRADPSSQRFRGLPVERGLGGGLLADRLMTRLSDAEDDNWRWFEDSLSYDNARMPQALIQIARDGDVIVTMGAGSIGAAAAELPATLATLKPAQVVERRRP